MNDDFFAEVVESSLECFVAQCWDWNILPTFGSLVEIKNKKFTFFGVVTQIKIGSSDPARQTFVYKKTEEELMSEQPQIFEFLETTFNVQILGYKKFSMDKIFYVLPPQPCSIHSFIKKTSKEVYMEFFKSSDFLYLLFASQNNNNFIDDILLTIMEELRMMGYFTEKLLSNFYQVFSLLNKNDYKRMKIFLKRAEEILWLPEQDSNLRPND